MANIKWFGRGLAFMVVVATTLLSCSPVAEADTYTFTTDASIEPNDATYDGRDIVVDGCVLTIDGSHAFASLNVINNGAVTHPANADLQTHTLDLTITGDLTIDAGSALDVSGRGYNSSNGPGQGADHSQYAAGAGYGGNGGDSTHALGGAAYGSILTPIDLGSGGGRTDNYQQGGPGGGAVRLDVGGTLTVNGEIRADGQNGGIVGSNYGGGGSGGAIYVNANVITGAGTLSAVGGDGALLTAAGGGGGGRIALYADDFDGFSWHTPAHGGDGYVPGGAGTTYFKVNSNAVGVLVADNNGRSGATTPLTTPEAFDLALRHAAIGQLTEACIVGDFALNSNAVLTHPAQGPALNLTVNGDAVIDPNTVIDVTGCGYPSSEGPGQGGDTNQYGAGAGYGGRGASSQGGGVGGGVYGSLTDPVDFGSGGGRTDTFQQGGPGGGAVRLTVAHTLTLNGEINAGGAAGGVSGSNYGGGGSGGSVFINVDEFTGSGAIHADGGPAAAVGAGGGGGGRISVCYNSNDFSGAMTAYGAGPDRFGGAGTIYVARAEANGYLYINNDGALGAYTDLDQVPYCQLLRVENGGVVNAGTAFDKWLLNLEVLDGGAITVDDSSTAELRFEVLHDVLIASGGKIDLSGRGYASRSGPGAGGDGPNYGCGGGHSGNGGRSADSYSRGPTSDGAFAEPVTRGSGGGGDNDGQNVSGGAGGGALRLNVGDQLIVDGEIRADGVVGGVAGSEYGGGGAGGSLWISAGDLSGAGAISADGGPGGNLNAGGGGGGHVAVYADADSFSGTITAYGGDGYERGGAGTVYLQSAGALGEYLLVDNGGVTGHRTELPGVTQVNCTVTVRNGGMFTHSGDLAIDGDLLLENVGRIHHHAENTDGLHVAVAGDADVDATSLIDLNRCGYAPRNGPGAGATSITSGGGAGHGGPGGAGSDVSGGLAYGSFTEPIALGSGGGEESDSNNGGPGGGAVHLQVDGDLSLEGTISADGGSGAGGTGGDNGGGAGGSIWIEADDISGAGALSAVGGDGGAGPYGGGAGGGRIAVHMATNSFTGTMTACGGTGYRNGGCGTIYVDSADGVGSVLLMDNCDFSGAETNLPNVTVVNNNLVIRRSARLTHAGNLSIAGYLTVENTGVITQPREGGAAHFTIAGDAAVQSGGHVRADGRGYAPRNGPAAGESSISSGAGGGHGGPGGDGSDTNGGGVYGLLAEPVDLGSGGGEETDSNAGGAGGGAIRLSIDGALALDGVISANGDSGAGGSGGDNGGGAGGSVWITAASISGAGSISAIGGNGGNGVYGGAGGGGRIALYCDDLVGYTGAVAAHAGIGYQNGGAGTIYTKTSTQTFGDVLYDNNGLNGPETPFTESDPFAYTVAHGAVLCLVDPVAIASLHVADGGVVTHSAMESSFIMRSAGDVTIDAGGKISAIGRGYAASTGPGQGADAGSYGAGAGYGGRGGDSVEAAGGETYGYEAKPLHFGSGGGNGLPETKGGRGGGMIHLYVDGTLLVNGELSADGDDGKSGGNPGGGGSGGSILLRADAVDGVGLISADGGDAGDVNNSGGGGGGRIAVYTCDLRMSSSLITAAGGLGYNDGEDGTVYNGSSTVEITEQPQGLTLEPGDAILLTVNATGDGQLSYQWRKDGVDLVDDARISGATTDTLTVVNFDFDDIGAYYVIITDDCGPFASDIAMVTIAADIDRDGDVDLSDLAILLANYGMTGAQPEDGDCTGDGVVNVSDLAYLLAFYGVGR